MITIIWASTIDFNQFWHLINLDSKLNLIWFMKVHKIIQHGLLEAADPRLHGVFDQQEMERLMIVGLWCTHMDYLQRPTIRQAAHVLNFEVPLPTLPAQVHASTNYPVSFSSLIPRAPASGSNRTQPSTSSNGSVTTGSSQSSSTTSELISPSAKPLHTSLSWYFE